MLGHELGVEKTEAADDQPRHQVDERHLAGVAGAAEHALAEEGAADRHAIEAAHQLAAGPALHAVGEAAVEEGAVEAQDLVIDPGFRPD